MDESEKRKQRLQAMLIGAAAQAEPPENRNLSSGSIHQLINPLTDPTFSNTERSPSTPRIDHYTDPMSASSGNKRSSSAAAADSNLPNKLPSPAYDTSRGLVPSPCSGQRSANMTPFLVHANQFQVNYSPHQGSFGMQPAVLYPALQSSLAPDTATPLTSHSYSHGSIGGNNRPPNSTASSSFQSPSGSRGGFQNSGPQSGKSAERAGRGRGYNSRFGNSPGRSGWSSSGRKGGREPLSASNNPEMYYSREMMEDPWDQLVPVIGNLSLPLAGKKISDTPASPNSWMPGSIRNREARVETASSSCSQPSRPTLAECLAQSFEEAAEDV